MQCNEFWEAFFSFVVRLKVVDDFEMINKYRDKLCWFKIIKILENNFWPIYRISLFNSTYNFSEYIRMKWGQLPCLWYSNAFILSYCFSRKKLTSLRVIFHGNADKKCQFSKIDYRAQNIFGWLVLFFKFIERSKKWTVEATIAFKIIYSQSKSKLKMRIEFNLNNEMPTIRYFSWEPLSNKPLVLFPFSNEWIRNERWIQQNKEINVRQMTGQRKS